MSKGQNETPTAVKPLNDFPGIKLLDDPLDLTPGMAQDQLNIQSSVQGQLNVRLGSLPVSFDYSA